MDRTSSRGVAMAFTIIISARFGQAADDPVERHRALDAAIRSAAAAASLTANINDPCPAKPLITPATVNGTLTTSSCIDPVINTREDVYSITGAKGQQFTVDYSSSAYDTYFDAYGDQSQGNYDLCFSNSNTYLIHPGDISRAKATCTFAQTGTYFIHAESLWHASDTGHPTTGPYTLIVNGGSPIGNPSIVSFTASPTTIGLGHSVTLSWVTSNATTVSIDQKVGTVPASGAVTVTPTGDTTYTLTAGGATTATATVSVHVITNPVVNVTALPAPMLEVAGSGGATTFYSLTNAGGASIPITLTQTGSFFTQAPASFTLAAGATQIVTITANAQPAGEHEGTSGFASSSFGSGVQVPVRLLAAAPPSGPVTADPAAPRVDVAAESGTNPVGSLTFTNNGTSTLNGVLTSDVPWVVPQSGVATIAPHQTATFTFTIDRTQRQDAVLAGSAEGSVALTFLSGSGSPFSKTKPADNTTAIPSVSLVKVVDTVKPSVTTAGIPALGSGEVALFIPGVGHTIRTGGKLFVSDVSLFNSQGSQSIDDLKLYYTSATGSTGSAATASLPSVPGQVSVAIADVVKNFNGSNEIGTLHIRSASASRLAVAASVLTSNNAAGTFGNSIPVFRSDRAAATGSALVLTGLRKDGSAHTDIYVQEVAGSPAVVKTDFIAADGSAVGSSRTDNVDAFKLLQLSDVVPQNAVAAIVTNTSTAGGSIAAYAAPVDETSGDTWAISDGSVQDGYAATEPLIIPVAGNVHGANNTFYRTDVAITNRGTTTATATLRYAPRGAPPIDMPINLGAKQSTILSDVIATLFGVTGDSIGYLKLTPSAGAFAVSARTYATVGSSAGTFGAAVPAVAAASALPNGALRSIAGLSDAARTTVLARRPGTSRTNFGLLEVSGQSVTVRVTFRFTFAAGQKASGIGAGSRDYALSGGSFLMLNSIAGEILGPARLQYADFSSAEADFQVISGAGSVILFTSSTDNATGDSLIRTR